MAKAETRPDKQIDFEITDIINEDKSLARFLNIFYRRRFPITAGLVLLTEGKGESAGSFYVTTRTIEDTLEQTDDRIGLHNLRANLRSLHVTSVDFPLEMGRFVDHDTGDTLSLEEVVVDISFSH
jgi:hypothetical protein